MSHTKWLINRNVLLTVLKAESLKSKHQCLGMADSDITFSLHPYVTAGAGQLPRTSFVTGVKNVTPVMRNPLRFLATLDQFVGFSINVLRDLSSGHQVPFMNHSFLHNAV